MAHPLWIGLPRQADGLTPLRALPGRHHGTIVSSKSYAQRRFLNDVPASSNRDGYDRPRKVAGPRLPMIRSRRKLSAAG